MNCILALNVGVGVVERPQATQVEDRGDVREERVVALAGEHARAIRQLVDADRREVVVVRRGARPDVRRCHGTIGQDRLTVALHGHRDAAVLVLDGRGEVRRADVEALAERDLGRVLGMRFIGGLVVWFVCAHLRCFP